MIQAAELIGTGLTTTGLIEVGVGIGVVFLFMTGVVLLIETVNFSGTYRPTEPKPEPKPRPNPPFPAPVRPKPYPGD